MPKILLVGASSQICRGWLAFSRILGGFQIFYLSREQAVGHLDPEGYLGSLLHHEIAGKRFDVVVNFVGASTQQALTGDHKYLRQAMRTSDEISLALSLQGAHYIYLSSGAIYKDLPGNGFAPESWRPESFYTEEKLRAELVHFEMSTLIRVSDLRVFGYLDTPNSASPGSLIGDLWSAYLTGTAVQLNSEQVLRDIAGPKEVAMALDALVERSATGFHDLYTRAPAGSIDLAEGLGLEVEILAGSSSAVSPTGLKMNYFSTSRSLGDLGYVPQRSTLEVVREAFQKGGAQL